ncbi:non-ribosomal peptide synthetase [Streptomyces tendae]|uniref:non-ribosomal peptide synthetase n=1 Tax=Streptomyces tendae TaxID=1932 RepID=UPI00249183DF|nr:amino acid adenylation domain-containing protein [Streptomyces tendae]
MTADAQFGAVSFAQERLLVLEQMRSSQETLSENAAYHHAVGFLVRGAFDETAFRESLTRVVRRHESLRTVFRLDRAVPCPVVRPEADVDFVSERRPDLLPERAAEFLAAAAGRPFDPAEGPLIRGVAVEMADDAFAVGVSVHQLVADREALDVIVHEMSTCYREIMGGPEAGLPEAPHSYVEYARRRREESGTPEHRAHLDYWRRTLHGAPELLAFPTDFPRPQVRTYRGATASEEVGPELLGRLERLAKECDATLVDVLLAAFGAFLGRISDQRDIVVGLALPGRADDPPAGTTNAGVGLFADTVAVRLDLSGAPAAAGLVRRVQEQVRSAKEHRAVSLDEVVAALATPQRELSHDPVVQAVLDSDLRPQPALDLLGARTEPLPLRPRIPPTSDLTLRVRKPGQGLTLDLTYRADLFLPETMRRWLRNFLVLLQGLADPANTAPVENVVLVVDDERDELLTRWNNTATTVADALIHELIDERSARWGDRPAVGCRDVVLSYSELSERSDRLGRFLRERGVGRGVMVGLCLSRSVHIAVAVLGVLKAGGAYVPLDPAFPAARLKFMVEDSGTRQIVTEEALAGVAGDLGAPLVVLDGADAPAIAAAKPHDSPTGPDVTGSDVAYVIYTSGSTGRPKGVAVEHRSLTNLAEAQGPEFGVTADTRLLQFAAFSFDVSVSDMFFTWAAGAFVQIAAEDERLGAALHDRLRESRITSVTLPPAAVATLPWEPGTLPDLRLLVIGGEAFGADLVAKWARDRTVIDAYGPTETTVWTTLAELRGGEVPVIGRPLANLRVYVLDGCLEPVPVGVTGELFVGGAGIARGYVGRPGLTSERFVADPFGPPGDRLYRTGDLARWRADGNLEFLGRGDDQVKIRGFRIELGEIEEALRSHPDVAQAVVMVRRDGKDATARLVAYVRAAGEVPNDGLLRAHLRTQLPGYMIPEVFVAVDAFPTTRAGKVERSALPAPRGVRPALEQPYVEPRDDTERRLARLWEAALDVDRVGVHDDFFELGGTSLRMVGVRARLTKLFPGREIPLTDLVLRPTVAGLAALLEGSR